MAEKQVGMRVYAVQDATETTVNLVGFGTYQGIKLMNDENSIASQAKAIRLEKQFKKADENPINISQRMIRSRGDTAEVREMLSNYEAQRELPMRERIRERLLFEDGSHCIHLDSGYIVWGSDVLWGPEERWEKYLRDRKVNEIGPPLNAQRWRDG